MRRFFGIIGRVLLWIIIFIGVVIGGAYAFGPRTPVDTTIAFDAGAIGADLDTWIAGREAAYKDLRPGLEKQIVWADPSTKAKTAFAIVYVHGFSASPGEVRPVPDNVAKTLGANLFFTRLAGHGRSGDAMAEASVNDWVNDYAEAIAIGERLGEKVIVMSASTGSSIVTWGLGQKDLSGKVAATIFISPNYGLMADGSFLLTQPFARQLAEAVVGPRRSFKPENELHGKFWTSEYPTAALLPMAATVQLALSTDVTALGIPALFVISPTDLVVDPAATRALASRWGGPHDLIEFTDAADPYQHVIAGDALSPNKTQAATDAILSFLAKNGIGG